ncbi:MAG: rRNA maturation RNase YbeY [Culicoidibacterales bacterium]
MLQIDFENSELLAQEEQSFLADATEILNYAFKQKQYPNNLHEVSILFVTDEEIKETNKQYRNKDAVTDVITFAFDDYDDQIIYDDIPDAVISLGEILVSVDRMRAQAIEYGHSIKREFCFLLLHGFLHIQGYDHLVTEDEKEMFALQEDILIKFAIFK